MKTIHKFLLQPAKHQFIHTKEGAIPLSVGIDPKGRIAMWMKVDPDAAPADMQIYCIGTGNDIPSKARIFLGSVTDAPFVWHFFTTEEDPI